MRSTTASASSAPSEAAALSLSSLLDHRCVGAAFICRAIAELEHPKVCSADVAKRCPANRPEVDRYASIHLLRRRSTHVGQARSVGAPARVNSQRVAPVGSVKIRPAGLSLPFLCAANSCHLLVMGLEQRFLCHLRSTHRWVSQAHVLRNETRRSRGIQTYIHRAMCRNAASFESVACSERSLGTAAA